MPFGPGKPIPLELKKTVPSPLTAENLKEQLNRVGLTCDQSHINLLNKYINEVRAKMPSGTTESFGIYDGTEARPAGIAAVGKSLLAEASALTKSSQANWEPVVNTSNQKYVAKLEYLQHAEHFKYLKKVDGSAFTGLGINTNDYHGTVATIDAIKNQFVQVASNASSILVHGVDKTDLESVFTNAIQAVSDKNASNYDQTNSKVMYLVENYDPGTRTAAGIGVLTVKWTLTIHDYLVKKQNPRHQYTLKILAWAVLYYDPDILEADYKKVFDHFGTN